MIHDRPKVEPIQMPINKPTKKQTMVFPYTRILAFKGNEILMHPTTWVNLEDTMLNETVQSQKAKY